MSLPLRLTVIPLVLLALGLLPVALHAQGMPSVSYELSVESAYAYGCVPPCMCPMTLVDGMAGTFNLTFEAFDGLFWHYQVSDIEWTVPTAPVIQITGGGSYQVGGELVTSQRLELDLFLDGGPLEHFDSGLIVGGVEFPAIHIDAVRDPTPCFFAGIFVHASAQADPFVRGDTNGDGVIDVGDAVFAVSALFVPGSDPPGCFDASDTNNDGGFNVADAVYLLSHLFGIGSAPPAPFPDCGADPDPVSLGCAEFTACP